MIKIRLITLTIIILVVFSACNSNSKEKKSYYEPTWESLQNHEIPQWLKEGKFGIYAHWGVYCYTGTQGNVTWNVHLAYMDPESEWAKDFYRVHGNLTPEFGYKDLIPKFTGKNFDADEWADIFAKSGAKFAGPVAEHHDGFAMWDTKYSKWNAANMGPNRDIVGEFEKAIKKKGMKFVTAFHHSANWYFYPTWDETKDCGNPEFAGLYGPIHEQGDVPNQEFLDEWKGKLVEVVDKYSPDFVWFDFGLDIIREDYVRDFVNYYYNKGIDRNQDVIISYKHHDLPPGVGLHDYELGAPDGLTQYNWITDTSIDDQPAWGYLPNLPYKSVNRLIDNLVDRVSKNGYLLLNVGPKWDGTIPKEAKKVLLGIGEWLSLNGEAIYGTTAWSKSGEGEPVFDEEREEDVFDSDDIRFTVKGDSLYAIILDWPGESVTIESLVRPTEEGTEGAMAWGYIDFDEDADDHIAGYYVYPEQIKSVTMLGDESELEWELIPNVGLKVQMPKEKPCEHAYVLRIVNKQRIQLS